MSTSVEQIKERLGIAEVVGLYLKLERAGSSLKARCPFHNEKTPSFFVSPARNSFYCFGCGKGGDIFSFVQEFEGLDFVGALRVLASRAGVDLRRVDPKVRSEHARIFLILEKATRFFENELLKNDEPRGYLKSRGLNEETMKGWRVGFAPNLWRGLFDFLIKEGFKPDEIEKAGLLKRKDNGAGTDSFYDTFRGRIMFPVFDSASRVIAFSGRILPSYDDGKTGKYINSPETVLFNKSEALYGIDRAKLEIRKKDSAILVEGQMDLLMAHQAGFSNTVASSGTALTSRQLERLKRLSENLLVSFDSDSAGEKAALRAIHLALNSGFNVKVIALSEKDPADLIAKDPKEFESAVSSAKHIIDFLLSAVLSRTDSKREQAIAIEKEVLVLIRMLPSAVERAHFIKFVAERSGLREDALWEAFGKISERAGAGNEVVSQTKKEDRFSFLARRVFGLLFFLEEKNEKERASDAGLRVAKILGDSSFAKARLIFEKKRDSLLAEAEILWNNGSASEKEISGLLENFEEERIRIRLTNATERLAQCERLGNKEDIEKYSREAYELSSRLSELKSARFANE